MMMFTQGRKSATSKAPQFKKSDNSSKMSCSASWTTVPMCSAVIVISGGVYCRTHYVSNLNPCRLVKEYEDPSLVPEYWVCSMNKVRGSGFS